MARRTRWRWRARSTRTDATSWTSRPARRSRTSGRSTGGCSRRRSPTASGTRWAWPRWRWATSRPTPTSTPSWPRAAPTCACSRARTSGTRTGRDTPPTSWAGRSPGRASTRRSTATAPASPDPRGARTARHAMAVTYASYLKLDELLALQQPLSDGPEHDETLFIVIHQVYELWFKQLLHELDFLVTTLARGDTQRAQHTLKRVLTILKVLVHQIDILETMTPLEFLSFRARLESGSGFQSFQFRELEFLLGNKRPEALDRYLPGSEARTRLERRLGEPTLWDAFLRWLVARGNEVPKEALQRDVTQPVAAMPALHPLLLRLYRTDPDERGLCERLVDLDEGLMEWRYRHVKMVERTIGTRRGTGGSAGAGYLRTTLNQPLFPDLWDIRTEL